MMSEEEVGLGDSETPLGDLDFGTKNEGIQVTLRGREQRQWMARPYERQV